MVAQLVNIILDGLIIGSAATAMSVSFIIVVLTCCRKSEVPVDRIARLLVVNMYVTLFIGCALILDIYCWTLYGHVHRNVSFDGPSCRIKAYLLHVTGCAFYYSYLLQAVYRLFRIAFHTKAVLQSFNVYISSIVLQWLMSFLQVTPVLLLGFFEYLPNDFHCQIAVENIHGLLMAISVVHTIPLSLATVCYLYTTAYIRKRSARVRTVRQQVNDRRDFLVLTRMFTLLGMMILSGLPTLGISLFYQLFGYLPFWAVQFQWLTVIVAVCCVSLIQVVISPTWEIFSRRSRTQDSALMSS